MNACENIIVQHLFTFISLILNYTRQDAKLNIKLRCDEFGAIKSSLVDAHKKSLKHWRSVLTKFLLPRAVLKQRVQCANYQLFASPYIHFHDYSLFIQKEFGITFNKVSLEIINCCQPWKVSVHIKLCLYAISSLLQEHDLVLTSDDKNRQIVESCCAF